MTGIVEIFEVVGRNRERDGFLLAGIQGYFVEGFQLLLRTGQRRLVVADIELHHLFTGQTAGILHRDGNRYRAVGRHVCRRESRFAVCKGGITQSMAEGEECRDFFRVVPAVPDKNILLVNHMQAIAGVTKGIERVRPVVGQLHRERNREFSAGIHRAAQHVGKGMAGLGTEIPRLHDGGNLIDPLHLHGISADEHQHEVGIDLGQFGNETVLTERQTILYPVSGLTILFVVFVETPDKNHQIGIGCQLDSLAVERVGIDTRLVDLAIAGTAGGISLRVDNLVAIAFGKTLQGRNFVFHFQLRRAAALGEPACGVVTNHQNLFIPRRVNGKKCRLLPLHRVVFQKHDSFGTDLTRRVEMGFGSKGAPGTIAVHGRAEYQTQDAGGLVIDRRNRIGTRLQAFQIVAGQIIIVVGKIATRGETVGIGSHLDVEAVENRLAGIVGSAPVGHDTTVEGPFAFEYAIEQQVVVAGMLTTHFVV